MRSEQEKCKARAESGGQREGKGRPRAAGGGGSIGNTDGHRDSTGLEALGGKSGSWVGLQMWAASSTRRDPCPLPTPSEQPVQQRVSPPSLFYPLEVWILAFFSVAGVFLCAYPFCWLATQVP